MKLSLLGYGKMGKMIESLANEKGHEIVDIEKADVCLDFSHPSVVLKHIQLAIEHKKDIVIGTTGWYEKIPEIQSLIEKSDIGAVYSPNFSIGIQTFLKMAEAVSKIMAELDEYDMAGVESHHKEKADAPSGTALALQKAIEKNGKKKCPFSALRAGYFPGTHTILFDSPFDTITMTHTARNRQGFAYGAIKAAEWIYGKKGFYSYET